MQTPQVFNVRDYGATGAKSDNARPFIQKAIDACAEAGGGMVYVPPGEYVTGMLHLCSNVRFFLEAGATLLLSRERSEFDVKDDWRAALFFGEDLHHVSLEGFGTVDGRAEYEWRDQDFDDRYIGERTKLRPVTRTSVQRTSSTRRAVTRSFFGKALRRVPPAARCSTRFSPM
jgi:hypothetical protein